MARDGFHDVVFPVAIGAGARGGPRRRTDVAVLGSGNEVRRSRWAGARRIWDVSGGIQTFADAETLVHFFEARQGRRYAFRFRDPFDHSSALGGAAPSATDQTLGVGDGTATEFPLYKDYGGVSRRIELAEAGSVFVAVDGAVLTGGAWSLSAERNRVILQTAPAVGQVITAGFLFDTPVRFTDDALDLELGARGAAVQAVGLTEIQL
ncbi:MAG: DUF2460 domain-containing protein [Pseudomonadota bacterium]